MLPPQAVTDIRANGVDGAPAYRGEPGTILGAAQPNRLTCKRFPHSLGGYESRSARRDNLTFQGAHTDKRRIPADAPVSYIAWHRERIVTGRLWWSDAPDAACHIPNSTEPGSRIKDGITFQSTPWAWRMSGLHEGDLSAGRATHELMNGGRSMTAASSLPNSPRPIGPWATH